MGDFMAKNTANWYRQYFVSKMTQEAINRASGELGGNWWMYYIGAEGGNELTGSKMVDGLQIGIYHVNMATGATRYEVIR